MASTSRQNSSQSLLLNTIFNQDISFHLDPNRNNSSDNSTAEPKLTSRTSPDAFVYIVVVLSVYALAMTILMIKYIRRENQEAQLSYYFHEFIKREKFSSPQYQNMQGLKAVKRTLSKFYQSMGIKEGDLVNSKTLPTIQEQHSDTSSEDKAYSDVLLCGDSGIDSEKFSVVDDTGVISGEDCEDLGSRLNDRLVALVCDVENQQPGDSPYSKGPLDENLLETGDLILTFKEYKYVAELTDL